jgi:oligopeptide/dipeptide ABC transporter ATP-binding protein
MPPLLALDDVYVTVATARTKRLIVDGVSLEIAESESLALVGESGSGKSMTARSIVRLLPKRAEVSGDVRFRGASVSSIEGEELRRFRSRHVAMVFQDPRAHINPVRTIADFMTEAMRFNLDIAPAEARDRARALLDDVAVHQVESVLERYPHQLSGGQLQRIMIATALAAEPDIILADEPTTALDVATQNEVMAIFDELRQARGLAMLLITHDLELGAACSNRTAVMYAGRLVEIQPSATVDEDPLHPYTAALLRARPSVDRAARRLAVIPGQAVAAFEAPSGCSFAPRCRHARDICLAERPPLRPLDQGWVACHRAGELRGTLAESAAHADATGVT